MKKKIRISLLHKNSIDHTVEDIIAIFNSYGLELIENIHDYELFFSKEVGDEIVYVNTVKKGGKSAFLTGRVVSKDKPWHIRSLIYRGGYGRHDWGQLDMFEHFDEFFIKQWKGAKLGRIESTLWETEKQIRLKNESENENEEEDKKLESNLGL